MTRLRRLMLDELQRRNYAKSTVRSYIHAVEDFAKYFHRSPERLGPEHIREYQVHLFRDCKLSPGTIYSRTSALRFLFMKTLRRPYLPDDIRSQSGRDECIVLSQEEVEQLIASARNLDGVPCPVYAGQGISRDLSDSGIFLYTESVIEEGSEVELKLTLPSFSAHPVPMLLRGRVGRVERTPAMGVAVEFNKVTVASEIPHQ